MCLGHFLAMVSKQVWSIYIFILVFYQIFLNSGMTTLQQTTNPRAKYWWNTVHCCCCYLWSVGKVNEQLHGSLIDVTDNHFRLSALCQLSSEHRPEENMEIKRYYSWYYECSNCTGGNSMANEINPRYIFLYQMWVEYNICTWSRGCRQTESHGERKSSWHPPPAPRHRARGVFSVGWSPPGSAVDVCPRHRACVLAGGPLQGACWGPPEYSGWWCPFQWRLGVRWWP